MAELLPGFAPAVRPGRLATGGGRAAGIASVGVTVETRGLKAALERYAGAFPLEARRAVLKVAHKIERGAKQRCPVDHGRLRASVHVVGPGDRGQFTYTDREGTSYDGTLSEWTEDPARTGIVEAIVGTNVEYAVYIEARGGKTKPPGMWREAIAAVRGELDAAVVEALRQGTPRELGG